MWRQSCPELPSPTVNSVSIRISVEDCPSPEPPTLILKTHASLTHTFLLLSQACTLALTPTIGQASRSHHRGAFYECRSRGSASSPTCTNLINPKCAEKTHTSHHSSRRSSVHPSLAPSPTYRLTYEIIAHVSTRIHTKPNTPEHTHTNTHKQIMAVSVLNVERGKDKFWGTANVKCLIPRA